MASTPERSQAALSGARERFHSSEGRASLRRRSGFGAQEAARPTRCHPEPRRRRGTSHTVVNSPSPGTRHRNGVPTRARQECGWSLALIRRRHLRLRGPSASARLGMTTQSKSSPSGVTRPPRLRMQSRSFGLSCPILVDKLVAMLPAPDAISHKHPPTRPRKFALKGAITGRILH